jgi:tetratricopeptide (TPR) repeat protein
MIARNEERFLRSCLNSVKGLVNEIILVDTGSNDKTVDIAREFGAKIYYFQWCDDFAAARNCSIDKATGDWILVLDADEELDRKTIPEIKRKLTGTDNGTAYFFKVINYLDENNDPGNSAEVRIIRLFPNREDVRYRRLIHEEIYSKKEGELKKTVCNAIIYHHGYTETLHKERNKGDRNINLLLKSIEKDPKSPFNYYNLGVSYYVQNRLEDCIKAFKTAQEKCDYVRDSIYLPSSYSLCAAALCRSGSYEEAKKQALKGIELSPFFYEAHFNLGKACVGLKQNEEAKSAFNMAISSAARDQFAVMDRGTGGWKACCELGLIYLGEDNPSEALKYFNDGLILLPGSVKLLINAAHCYRKLKFYDHSRDYFERAHALEPERLDICYDLMDLYDKLGFPSDAISLIEEILDYYASNKDLFFELAKRYDYAGNYRLAVHYYTQTLVLDEKDGSVYFQRARCYWYLGATRKARNDLRKAYELVPDLLKGFTLYDFV